ncbi:MAG: hypothetical protein H0X33_01030 [Taibaiella sp.]|nr:hypothetical protein [Taibaiella sp.]
MKALPENNTEGEWSSSLIKDLSFIKKNLRYPLSKKTLVPGIIIGLVIALVLRITFIGWTLKNGSHRGSWATYLLIFFIAVPLVISIARYIQTLKFIAIPTAYYLGENMQLLQKFLESERLITLRHPDAPEVFQIVSKSVSQYKDEREIMIFIADDKRILINSHFTNTGFTIVPASKHYKQMGKMLSSWISAHTVNTGNSLVYKGF